MVGACKQETDAAGEAVTADVSSRAPQAEQQPASTCSMQQPLQLSPVDENAHSSHEMQQSQSVTGAIESAPKAARQTRLDATVMVCGSAVGGQQTCHSSLSGGSGTSDEATVTINNNPRLATPALTGTLSCHRPSSRHPTNLCLLQSSASIRSAAPLRTVRIAGNWGV